MEWYWYLLILLASLYLFWSYMDGNKDYWAKNGIKFTTRNIIINFMRKHFLEADLELYEKFKNDGFGGCFEFRRPVLYLTDLDIMRNILVKDFDHFVNRRAMVGIANGKDSLSYMLFIQEGQFWKNLRSTLSPIFTTGKIRRLFDTFETCGQEFVQQIKKGSTEVDVEDMVGKYTMSVIASVVFGVDARVYEDFGPGKENEFISHANKFNNFTPWLLIKFIFISFFPRFARYFDVTFIDRSVDIFFTKVVEQAIKERLNNPDRKMNDFLDLMLESRSGKLNEELELSIFEKEAEFGNKSKVPMNDQLIAGNCILFLAAGFDTTKQGLIWSSFEMAVNQEIQQRLYEELKAQKDSENGLNYESINNLEYLNMFFNEVLRKYPPNPRLERRCEKDYKIESKNGTKFTIPKGMLVGIPTYAIHHDEEIYPEPKKFDPERFSADVKNTRHPYAYQPFGHGPRNCIGMRFALTETKVALANLVLNFHITPTEKTDLNPKIKNNATMKPNDKMWLNFSPRN